MTPEKMIKLIQVIEDGLACMMYDTIEFRYNASLEDATQNLFVEIMEVLDLDPIYTHPEFLKLFLSYSKEKAKTQYLEMLMEESKEE